MNTALLTVHSENQPTALPLCVSGRAAVTLTCDTTGAIIAELLADLHLTESWERRRIPVQLSGR